MISIIIVIPQTAHKNLEKLAAKEKEGVESIPECQAKIVYCDEVEYLEMREADGILFGLSSRYGTGNEEFVTFMQSFDKSSDWLKYLSI